MKKIINITPIYSGYNQYTLDENGKIKLPRNNEGLIQIYRKNTVNYGNGLIGLLDGSKIATKDWQDLRKCFVLIENDGTEHKHWCIGGSDSGALLGISQFETPLELYNEKKSFTEKTFDEKTQYLFEYGHCNEELIAMGFQTLTNMEVCKDNTVFFREDTGFLLADIDFFVRHPDGMFSILEIKSTNSGNVETLNEYRNGRVKKYYYSQAVLHYPLALGNSFKIKGTFFAIGYNNNLKDIIICHFDRDLEQEKILFSAEKEFSDCLMYDTPPQDIPSSNTNKILESLKKKYPVAKEKTTDLTPDTLKAVEEYLALQEKSSELKKKIKKIESDADIFKTIIIDNMADAELSTEFELDGNIMFCSYKNKPRVNINKTLLQNKYPDVYNEVASNSISRTFSISKVKK